jgi:hypothetical protein
MKKLLFYFASTGWILALLVHVLSITDIDIASRLPFVWILHLGIFAVWIPMILDLIKNEEIKQFQQARKQNRNNSTSLFKIIFKKTPTWLKIIAVGGFFYAGINFILFSISQQGSATIKEGQYILHNHGQLIRTLTEQEYHHFKANEVRGFSGHWLAFYGIAAAILFPFYKVPNDSIS